MITTIEELGLTKWKSEKKMGRLLLHERDDYVGKLVTYKNEKYLLLECSQKYAYLGDLYRNEEIRVRRHKCFVPSKQVKTNKQLIREIKESRPDLQWRHYAMQGSGGTSVEGRDSEGELIIDITL